MTHEMPVTMRYSASLDRPYEDGSEVNKDRQSSTEQPYSSGSESYSAELWNDVQRNKNNLEAGFSDSMDSLGLDDDSQSSASGHSRHHSSDGGNCSSPAYPTRPLTALTPKPSPFNPLQFVKTITSPLVKKAEEQIKQYEEVKKVKELVKEEAEEWQSNLDGWKSRRRLVSQKSVQRVEEVKQIEEEIERAKRKSKTFSEMMEERSKRGVTKPLPSVYSDDSFPIEVPPLAVEEDFDSFTHNEDLKFDEKTVEDSQNVQKLTSNNGHNKDGPDKLSNIIEVNDNKEKAMTDTKTIENDEMKINDGVLSLQRNNAQDTKVIDEDFKESSQREPGELIDLSIQFRRHVERKDFGFSLKNVKGIGTEVFIEAIQEQSPAALAGLNANDEVIAINGEQCLQERCFSAIVFAIKQALHTGQIQLSVYRYQNPDIVSVLQNQKLPEVKDEICHLKEQVVETLQKVDVKKRRSLFEQPIISNQIVLNRRSLDLTNNIVGKVASLENSATKYKSSELLNVNAEINKNGFKKSIPDLNAQVGSGLKYGFELASTLQETPIVNSPPHSPIEDRQMDTILNFDLMKDEDVVVVSYGPLTALDHSVKSPEPPNEKPPPPPSLVPTGDVKLRRVESTKRILKEIHKRRSNFLGIDDDDFQQQIEQQMSQMSPPPNVDEILLKLERERVALNTPSSDSDISFDQEIEATLFSPTNSSLKKRGDIDQGEQEIIKNLEWEEEQKVCGNGLSAAEILTTEVPKPSTAVKVVLGKSVASENLFHNKGKSLEEKELELKMQEERLRSEKEKLRREQEQLLRRKKEYEEEIQRSQSQQFQMQQNKTVVVESYDMGGQKMMTPSLVTLNLLQPVSSIVPGIKQSPPPILTKPKPNEDSSLSSKENTSPPSLPKFQILSKPNLVALSAPPKAKLMDGDDWQQKKKRENYHQHWLVQEAEFRRLQAAQAKDSVKSRPVDSRLLNESSHKARHVNEIKSPQHHTNGLNAQEHLQKLAPRPPAKPSFQTSASNNNNKISNSQLSPDVNSSLHNQSSSNISDSGDFQMLSVSGKKRCSHCGIELGRGAAMIIESLHLYYHIGCFQCCVCHIQLGNGTSGTDVRVRSQKLHCHNCYSNDKGLKFSKV